MNKNYNEAIKTWFLRKQKQLEEEKEAFNNEEGICIHCGKPTNGTIIHDECVEEYNANTDYYEHNATTTCSNCGNIIYDINYRCPICFTKNEFTFAPFNLGILNASNLVQQDNIRKEKIENIKEEFGKDFPEIKCVTENVDYFFNCAVEDIQKERKKIESAGEPELNKIKNDINNAQQQINAWKEIVESNNPFGFIPVLILCIMILLAGIWVFNHFKGSINNIFDVATIIILIPAGFGASCTLGILYEMINTIITKDNAITEIRNCTSLLNTYNKQLMDKEEEIKISKTKANNIPDEYQFKNYRKDVSEFITNLNIPINTSIIIKEIKQVNDINYTNYKKEHKLFMDIIHKALVNYKNKAINKEELFTALNKELNFIPVIERDRFIENINKFPPQLVNIDNIEHSIRYYFRFKDILTGNINVNETTIIRRFQTSFFGTLDWQKLIDNPKTATKVLKATMPIEAVFSPKYETNEGYDAEPTQHYLINTTIDTFTNAFYNEKYTKEDIEEYKLYIYTIIVDYIGTVAKINEEADIEARREAKAEEEAIRQAQWEHEKELADKELEAEKYREMCAQREADRAEMEKWTAQCRVREAEAITRRQNEETTKAINNLTKKVEGITNSLEKASKSSGLTPNEKARLKNLHNEWSRM